MEATRRETLVALDWSGEGLNIQPILDFVGEHLIEHQVTTSPHWRTGEPILTHRVSFNSRQVRNTYVSGVAYRHGWLSHVELG